VKLSDGIIEHSSRRERNMTKKKTFAVLWVLFFTCLLMAFNLTGISYGATKGEPSVKEWKGENASSGKIAQLAQGKKRTVALAGSSVDKVMPPPCTVTAVKGRMVTLRDFKGQVDTVEVTDTTGIRVGEKAVVKNGHLTLGLVPE
jgi:hypothetical protein